jgi:hypothetical protein
MSSGEQVTLEFTAPVSLGQALLLQPTVGASRVGRP